MDAGDFDRRITLQRLGEAVVDSRAKTLERDPAIEVARVH